MLTKHYAILFVVVIVAVMASHYISTKMGMSSFDEFEEVK